MTLNIILYSGVCAFLPSYPLLHFGQTERRWGYDLNLLGAISVSEVLASRTRSRTPVAGSLSPRSTADAASAAASVPATCRCPLRAKRLHSTTLGLLHGLPEDLRELIQMRHPPGDAKFTSRRSFTPLAVSFRQTLVGTTRTTVAKSLIVNSHSLIQSFLFMSIARSSNR